MVSWLFYTSCAKIVASVMKKPSITSFYIFDGPIKKIQHPNADVRVIGKHIQVIFTQACAWEGERQERDAAARLLEASNESCFVFSVICALVIYYDFVSMVLLVFLICLLGNKCLISFMIPMRNSNYSMCSINRLLYQENLLAIYRSAIGRKPGILLVQNRHIIGYKVGRI